MLDNVIITVVFPLFGIMLAGYLSGRCGLFNEKANDVLSRFVFLIAMPALVFISLSRVPVGEFFNWPFLAALGGGMLAIFLLGSSVSRWGLESSLTTTGLHGLTAMFSSTAYIGLPIVLSLFGDEALVPGVIGAVITGALFMPMAVVLAEVDRGSANGRVIVATAVAVVRSPPVLSTAAGLSVSALDVTIYAPLATFCDLLGGAFIPCSLFAAGLFLAHHKVSTGVVEIGGLAFAKLMLHPLVTWLLAFRLLSMDPMYAAVAVIQAALPVGVPVFVLAQHYKTFVEGSSAVIVITTAMSVVTITGWLFFLEL